MRTLGAAVVVVAAGAAAPAIAQVSRAPPTEPQPCSSVVVIRCERPDAKAVVRRDQARKSEQRRRAVSDPPELDRIIIEADPVRRGVEETMAGAFGAHAAGGTYTFTTGEGSQCSCMNRCPPVPFPCCQCSIPTRGYGASPGSSPLR